MKISTWNHCYDDSWAGLIVPEAFSHPAKFAPGLIRRIFEHCLEHGYLKKGDTIVDPFAGIGGGGIFAAPMGLKWRGVELEGKFCTLGQENFKLHYRDWIVMGYPLPVLVPGDSRRLSQVLQEADLICTSPPYAESDPSASHVQGHSRLDPLSSNFRPFAVKSISDGYNDSRPYSKSNPSNIGNLKSGNVEAVITSPPYIDSCMGGSGEGPGACGAPNAGKLSGKASEEGYGRSSGQIGRMKAGDVGAVVTSPPWEKLVSGGEGLRKLANAWNDNPKNWKNPYCRPNFGGDYYRNSFNAEYGQSPNQIGQEQGQSYWEAVRDVYAECYKILKPQGVIIIVVKSYIKAGRRVPLPMQTLKLLIHLGFTPLERIKAMLVKQTVTPGLFGEVKRTKSRKSFFRRLCESKGSPAIDWEEVLICRK